jgi:hypothetical protein
LTDFESDPGPSSRLAELVADPAAARWANDCAWVPGTGHCRNRSCGPQCLFHAQREAEAKRVNRARQARRFLPRAVGDRMVRLVGALRSALAK